MEGFTSSLSWMRVLFCLFSFLCLMRQCYLKHIFKYTVFKAQINMLIYLTIKITSIFIIPQNFLLFLCNTSLLPLQPIPRQMLICFVKVDQCVCFQISYERVIEYVSLILFLFFFLLRYFFWNSLCCSMSQYLIYFKCSTVFYLIVLLLFSH